MLDLRPRILDLEVAVREYALRLGDAAVLLNEIQAAHARLKERVAVLEARVQRVEQPTAHRQKIPKTTEEVIG